MAAAVEQGNPQCRGIQTGGAYGRRAGGNHAGMVCSRGDQLDDETAQRVPDQKWWRVQRSDECHQVVGVVTKAQWCDHAGTLVQGQLMMAQRRGVHRVATRLESSPGRRPLLPSTPRAVNQNDVLGVGHENKGDS
jgi:hypothetical protein